MKVRWLIGCVAILWAGSLSATVGSSQPTPQESQSSGVGFVFDGRIVDALEFFKPHESGNGRSCATCHRPEDNFGLTPATVEARYQLLQARRRKNPDADDPLFRSIDADDFNQDFTTLRTKALVRVKLPLKENVTLVDDPTATSVLVFRSVPTVVNARLTAPFQAEGRQASLPEQALAAMREHSEVTQDPSERELRRLARFQEHLFSSDRVTRQQRGYTGRRHSTLPAAVRTPDFFCRAQSIRAARERPGLQRCRVRTATPSGRGSTRPPGLPSQAVGCRAAGSRTPSTFVWPICNTRRLKECRP